VAKRVQNQQHKNAPLLGNNKVSRAGRQYLTIVSSVAVAMSIGAAFFLWPNTQPQRTIESPAGALVTWQDQLTYARKFNSSAQGERAKPFANYVGSQACIRCHQAQHKSYSQTLHSKSFREPDSNGDPAVGRYIHAASSRTYESYHDGEQLRHRETLVSGDNETIAITDIPMKYVVGSGEHAKSYLYESDGFLFQSPITWYAETGRWEMSPGYNRPDHKSFTRVVTEDCLFCHVGMIERASDNESSFQIVEQAIGCERCHGPGQSHVAFHAGIGQRTRSYTQRSYHAKRAKRSANNVIFRPGSQ
jgi:hypothetical protein